APIPGLTPPTGQKRPRLHAQRPQSALLRGTARGRREPSMRRYPQRIAALLAETPGMGIRLLAKRAGVSPGTASKRRIQADACADSSNRPLYSLYSSPGSETVETEERAEDG